MTETHEERPSPERERDTAVDLLARLDADPLPALEHWQVDAVPRELVGGEEGVVALPVGGEQRADERGWEGDGHEGEVVLARNVRPDPAGKHPERLCSRASERTRVSLQPVTCGSRHCSGRRGKGAPLIDSALARATRCPGAPARGLPAAGPARIFASSHALVCGLRRRDAVFTLCEYSMTMTRADLPELTAVTPAQTCWNRDSTLPVLASPLAPPQNRRPLYHAARPQALSLTRGQVSVWAS